MQPDVPQNQSVQAADLPPTPDLAQAPAPALATPTSAPAAVSTSSLQQTVEQAKQLTTQYKQDPFKLGNELGALKVKHLAEQYHIVPNSVEG